MKTLRPADPIATFPNCIIIGTWSATAVELSRALCSWCRGRIQTASFKMMLSLLCRGRVGSTPPLAMRRWRKVACLRDCLAAFSLPPTSRWTEAV